MKLLQGKALHANIKYCASLMLNKPPSRSLHQPLNSESLWQQRSYKPSAFPLTWEPVDFELIRGEWIKRELSFTLLCPPRAV